MEKLRQELREIIFGTTTFWGRAFDLVLIIMIFLSIITVTLETVPSLKLDYHGLFISLEWFFTVIFTIEYLARIWCTDTKRVYIFSFFGIVDLLSILPTYLRFFIPGAQTLMVIRMFRLLRIFRILKMVRFIREGRLILLALRGSFHKILVFIFTVSTIVTIMGALMYLIEGEKSGFSSIPTGMYWAIVTVTTVGFGDITPITPMGQFMASILMLMGYAIIAVPTGLVTAEFVRQKEKFKESHTCSNCGFNEIDIEANYCRRCGNQFDMTGKEHFVLRDAKDFSE